MLQSPNLKAVSVKPHLHEQVFLENFSLRDLFCSCRLGLVEENDNFLLEKCTCSKAGVPVFQQVHLKCKKLSYAKLARVDALTW